MAGAPEQKRKRSEDGLLGLLGTYASDEEEADEPTTASPKRLRAETGSAEPTPREQSEEPLTVDLTAVLAAASQQQEAAAAAAAAAAAEDAAMADAAGPDAAERPAEEEKVAEEDPDAFLLPPELAEPPEAECPPEVQARVREYLRKQEETGTTISSALRSLSGYRNPDFLQHCVLYDKIQEHGSCYPVEVFDPNGLPEEDFYERLAVEWQQHCEERQRGKGQAVDFARGGSEHGRPPPPGLSAGSAAASSMAASIVAQAKAAAAAGQRASKSKWDAAKR